MGSSSTFAARIALLCATLAAAFPAWAQMYKWVDERGMVTYSNNPPPDTAQKKVDVVAERVSVYTPDAELNRAMSAEGRREARAATLGRRLEAERAARRMAAAASGSKLEARRAAAYERCIAGRGVDCEAIRSGTGGDMTYGDTGSYGPQFVVGARNFPPNAPFFVSNTPPTRIGINPAPPVGIDDRPPVGADPRAQRNRALGVR